MNRKTLSTLVSTLLIVSGTSPIFAASNTAQISSSQAVNLTQPKIKLEAKTINEIKSPKLPSAARIPEKKIKPKHVPVIDQLQPGRPSDRGKLSGVAHQPRVEASTPVTIEKPQLETNFQPNRIKQIQEAINTARLLDHIKDIPGAGEMPARVLDDPLADTALGGYRPEVGEGLDVHGILRDLLYGRGGNKNDAKIGRDNEAPNLANYGAPSAEEAFGVPKRTGKDGYYTGSSRGQDMYNGQSRQRNNRNGTHTQESFFIRRDGIGEYRSTTYGASNFIITTTVESELSNEVTRVDRQYDEPGRDNDMRNIYEKQEDGTWKEKICIAYNCFDNGTVEPPPEAEQDSQPNETASGKYGDCNPVTGWGCKKKGAGDPQSIWDKLTQPSTGEDGDTGPGSGAPSVGAVAVTNPDEFHQTGGGGGSGNTEPYDPRDPEEGFGLDSNGPEPIPSGPSPVYTAEALDEAMGAATFE